MEASVRTFALCCGETTPIRRLRTQRMVAATRWRGTAALLSGRSPEDLLREATNRLIESTAPAADLLGEMRQLQSGFVPQPQTFSVYA
jgi:hypothetical protein